MKKTKEINLNNVDMKNSIPSKSTKRNFVNELMRLYYKYNSDNKEAM